MFSTAPSRWLLLSSLFLAASGGCSGKKVGKPASSDVLKPDSGAIDGPGQPDATLGIEDAAVTLLDGGVTNNDSDGSQIIPCALTACSAGQRCEQTATGATCVDNGCSDLHCGATEECASAPLGGHLCKSIACSSDVQCEAARHCDGTKCVADVCEPDVQHCDGNRVFQCSSNGGVDKASFACAGNAYFSSACSEPSAGSAQCSCQDDWDCPSFTQCNVGVCQGTGVAPTCTLPALPFNKVLPTLEFRWGGTSTTSKAATGRAFSDSAQVAATPVVANLTDDNGDGLINELDFPEIVFLTYTTDIANNGVVRAVHAGGPARGNDYFASCGAKYWKEGDDISAVTCAATDAVARPGGGLAIADLDYDGIPEIVVGTENGSLQILDNRGRVISETTKIFFSNADGGAYKYPQVGLANLDNSGFVEIVVGRVVVTLEKVAGVLQMRDVFVGQGAHGAQDDGSREFGPTACPANVLDANPNDQDVSQEIVVGTVLYALPTAPTGVTRRSECAPADTSDYCKGFMTLVWNARTLPENTGVNAIPNSEAYCAVADVLGVDPLLAPGPGNALDGKPEVILVSNGRLLILDAATGVLRRKVDVEAGQRGGAPNVDDFDGDGFPEVAMASSGFYTVIDLQDAEATFCPAWSGVLGGTAQPANAARNPGAACTSNADCNAGSVCNTTSGSCVCLHNGWRRKTEDDSSKVTSSSVFDFNGDGAAEVVYGDECYFRVYDGRDGDIELSVPSLSRTVLENPVVADVDNDGNAEIVFVNNNETLQCGETTLTYPDKTTVARADLPNGIQVWGDSSDTWVSARRIWNQHAYHVTNITESAQVPVREPESWRPYGNRFYNTYRSQPRAYGVAPDLSLTAMQVSSPDVACGQLSDRLEIAVLVKNLGDLRVGPGVEITFYGVFAGSERALLGSDGKVLKSTLTNSLEPSASLLVSMLYRAEDDMSGVLPEKVVARIDEAGAERECIENNNQVEQQVEAGAQLADVRLEMGGIGGNCASKKIFATVHNDGSLAASNVRVRLYAGDPSAGGQTIGETVIAGPIAPGASVTSEISVGAVERNITVYGIADPDSEIEECNNANNVDDGPDVMCGVVIL